MAGGGSAGYIARTWVLEARAPMSFETLEFLLLLGGWIVAFLLGRELQTGYRLWRLRVTEERTSRPEG